MSWAFFVYRTDCTFQVIRFSSPYQPLADNGYTLDG